MWHFLWENMDLIKQMRDFGYLGKSFKHSLKPLALKSAPPIRCSIVYLDLDEEDDIVDATPFYQHDLVSIPNELRTHPQRLLRYSASANVFVPYSSFSIVV